MSTANTTDISSRNSQRSYKGKSTKGKMAMNDITLDLSEIVNFSLPPRASRFQQSAPRRGRRGITQNPWNKEKFVNAQYRFMMKPTGDYVVHFADPDIYFQWSDIEQVLIPRQPSSDVTKLLTSAIGDGAGSDCPICLSVPVAPRMTKCGHIFCYPCVLRYLDNSSNRWSRCPICFDSITETHLKKVKWIETPKLESSPGKLTNPESHLLTMRLMHRPQITTLSLPHSPTWPSEIVPPLRAPFHFLPDVYQFARFMLATPDYLRQDFAQDLIELDVERRILNGMGDVIAVHYVDAAYSAVNTQITAVDQLETPALISEIAKAVHDLKAKIVQTQLQVVEASSMDFTPSEEGPNEFLNASQSTSDTHRVRQRRNVNPPPPSNSAYYFYQAADGRPIFLHPLDIRILLHRFSSYACFPPSITVRAEASEESTINEELRKRCKYLGHLPESADVMFVVADLERVVGMEGLQPFEGALKMRRAKRQEKLRREERAKIRSEELEREKERNEGVWRDVDQLTVNFQQISVEDDASLNPGTTSVPSETAGAWGERSFASATNTGSVRPRQASRRELDEVDTAWHELERQATGGRKKGRNKLVVIGGAGGRRRR